MHFVIKGIVSKMDAMGQTIDELEAQTAQLVTDSQAAPGSAPGAKQQ